MIADVTIDQLVTFGYVMGRLTSPTSIGKNESKAKKIHSACVLFNKMIIYVNIMTFVLQTSIKTSKSNILDPVVQSIVSLTISLRHKFVKQISAKVTNTLLFFVEKM